MSGQTNDQLQFQEVTQRPVYRTHYVDPNNNVWRLTITGVTEAINQFIEARSFFIAAVPAGSERIIPSQSTPVREDLRYRDKDGSVMQDDAGSDLDRLPRLEFSAELIDLRLEPPYRIEFLVDPPQGPNELDCYSLYLNGQSSADFSFSADFDVRVSAWIGEIRKDWDSGISGSLNAPGNGSWTVYVRNLTNGGNAYSLSGEINVL